MHADVTAVFTHTNPVRPYRGNGRPEAAYVIERMVDLAADELGDRSRPSCGGATTFAPDAMPFKTALTFTYDSGEFEKSMDMALKLADVRGLREAPRRSAQARQAARHRPLQHHRARRRAAASRAPRSASTSPAR